MIAPTSDYVLFATHFNEVQDYLIEQCRSHSKVFVLCDENTLELCFPILVEHCEPLSKAEILVVEPGEQSKTLAIAEQLFMQLMDSGADKRSLLINLGGGVITDIGGWVGANYKRGIDFIHIPTSLMAMTDAAIGGKTGLDLGDYKNMIGLVAFAKCTLVCSSFLETLPPTELLSGRAEMVKHALLCDQSCYDDTMSNILLDEPLDLDDLIFSAKVKLDVVSKDPFEHNIRKSLNAGHTIGHALESWFLSQGRPVAHGIAVAAGLSIEIQISTMCFPESKLPAQEIALNLIDAFQLRSLDWPEADQWMHYAQQDKKNTDGQIRMALIKDFGQCDIETVATLEQMKAAYAHFRALLAL
jgi:3-dehydroquinate synthase